MHKVHYAGNVVYTGSAISQALLEYARALAQNAASATVTIPVYYEDGTRGTSEFLIGPSSQVVADSVESDWEEIIDAEVVAEIQDATHLVADTRALPVERTDDGSKGAQFPDFGDL
jgi:hypothetical protein